MKQHVPIVSLELHIADQVSSSVTQAACRTALCMLLLTTEDGKPHQEVVLQLLGSLRHRNMHTLSDIAVIQG
jgi:hypothetical protein